MPNEDLTTSCALGISVWRMRHHHIHISAWLARSAVVLLGLEILFSPGQLRADVLPSVGILERAITAEAVFVGKVTEIEKEAVIIEGADGGGKGEEKGPTVKFQIAVVKITDPLIGAEHLGNVRVGFDPRVMAVVPHGVAPEGRDRHAPRIPPLPQLKKDQEWLFFLNKHASGKFWVMPELYYPLSIDAKEDREHFAGVMHVAAVLANPMKELTAEKAEDRSFAAVVLLESYDLIPAGTQGVKVSEVPLEESRLIMKGLTESDWNIGNPVVGGGMWQTYLRHRPSEKDGWVSEDATTDFNEFRDDFACWLAGPGADYRLKKRERVRDKKAND